MHAVRENHIDHLCPSCLQPHGGAWKDEWHGYSHYQTATCQNCDFEIFKKSEEMSSGKF